MGLAALVFITHFVRFVAHFVRFLLAALVFTHFVRRGLLRSRGYERYFDRVLWK